jgi:hypothetical protein
MDAAHMDGTLDNTLDENGRVSGLEEGEEGEECGDNGGLQEPLLDSSELRIEQSLECGLDE